MRPGDRRTGRCLETSILPGEVAPADSGYADPSPELLARLGTARAVRPFSACAAEAGRTSGGSGEGLLRHRIGRPFLVEPGTYLIAAAEYCGARCGMAFTCHVEWLEGEWIGTGCAQTATY
jgi:hypothetical protein